MSKSTSQPVMAGSQLPLPVEQFAQAPAVQSSTSLQALPQVLQFRSPERFASQPLAVFPSQSSKPVGQPEMQVPASQDSPLPQAVAQSPQWLVSTSVSTSQPLFTSLSQSAVPVPQFASQVELTQYSPVPQAVSQPPQWPGSAVKLASQPLPVSPSQSS